MGTSNSSTVTRERAATLAGEIGAHHTPSAIAPLTSYYLPTYRLTDLPTYRLTDLPTYCSLFTQARTTRPLSSTR